MRNEKYTNISISVASFLILLMSFQFNALNATTKTSFEDFQRGSESMVLGRIVRTQNDGYSSNGGFLGTYLLDGKSGEEEVTFNYEAYINNAAPESGFAIYKQSFGLQGYFYASVDNFLRFMGIESGSFRLNLHKLFTSALCAALLVVYVHFVRQNFGRISAITCVLLLAISQWLVVFSNNLYWMFFLIILPFVMVAFFFQLNSQNKNALSTKRIVPLYAGVFVAVLLKSLAGYEYISTVLMAAVTPLIFFALRDDWGLRDFSRRLIFVGLSGVAGFASALLIHLISLISVLGSLTNGIRHIWITIAKRTHGDPDSVRDIYRESLESDVIEVVSKYLSGNSFNLNSLIGFGGYVEFWHLIILLLILSTIISFSTHLFNRYKKYNKLNLAAGAMLWFSFLAPLSWHVLAKGHSYIHLQLNHVLWYVPFLLVGFAYIGFALFLFISLRQLPCFKKIRSWFRIAKL